MLASSGIDYDVKIWMPIAEEPNFDGLQAGEVSFIILCVVVSLYLFLCLGYFILCLKNYM